MFAESCISSEEFHDADISETDTNGTSASNLTALKESGLSLSLASLYSGEYLLQEALKAINVTDPDAVW